MEFRRSANGLLQRTFLARGAGHSAVLAVPSVIVPAERTFLLNPEHHDFGKIKTKDTGSFYLDPRLR